MKWPWQRKDEELDAEIRQHFEMAARERMARGERLEQARANARREFGNVGLVKEVTREMWGWASLERLLQDLRFGARMLRKNPGFTLIAVLTLALGIGANVALFSVVNGVLLNPLPFPQPEQLVSLHQRSPNFATGSLPYPNFRDWQKDNQTFSALGLARGFGFSLTGTGEAELVGGQFISADFFAVLGVKPALGRAFALGEDERGGTPLVLISARLWQRKFGAALDVLGKSLTLDDKNYTIVGVLPADFTLSLRNFSDADVYVPIGQWNNPLLQDRGAGLGLYGIGRLEPGVTVAQAQADLDRVAQNLAVTYPDTNKDKGATLVPLKERLVGNIRPALLMLLGAVGFVLLIACVNVSNLLLARATGRTREFAIRAALGAGAWRLLRQSLTESTLLACAGGGLGLLVASWGTWAALAVLPTALPRAAEIGLDVRVLVFMLVVSLLAGALAGLAPALNTSQGRLAERLKESGRSASGGRGRAQGVLVAVEMALALVLLIGAGLMIRSLSALWKVDPGFRADNVLTFGLNLPPSMRMASPQAIRANLRDLSDQLNTAPGVEAASFSWGATPLEFDDERYFWLASHPKPASQGEMNMALTYIVEPAYLSALRIPLKRGRFFTAQDDERAPDVVVIDESFARQYFGNADPLGQHINLDGRKKPAQIIGVVGHVKQWSLDTDAANALQAQLYLPFRQTSDRAMPLAASGVSVVVRSQGAAPALFDSIRRVVQSQNGQNVIFRPQTMNEVIATSLAARRFSMILLEAFAVVALLLASVGLYGVISYLVGQRTHEIGIRLALGAQGRDVLRLILGHGLRMALGGVALGLPAALGLTRLLGNLLYGVSATDPLTFAMIAALLLGVALLACWVPARRAGQVDPLISLRHE